VHDLVAEGVTVFLTTQYLEEADELADRIAILDDGRFVAEGTPVELKRLVPGGHLHVDFADEPALAAAAAMHPDGTRDTETLTLRIPSDGALRSMRELLDGLDEAAVESVSLHTPDLDDVFLALTGHHAETTDKMTVKEPAR